MRWTVYYILAYVALGFQIGLSPYVRYQGAEPNLALLAVIYIAINAPRDAALLAAFGIGVLQDLLSAHQPGLYALSYGLVAMFVAGAQHVVYREHPLTHFSLALVGGLVTMCVLVLHDWLIPPFKATVEGHTVIAAVRVSPATLFTGALYTAVLAPLIIGGLQRVKGLFNFKPQRRRAKPW